VSKCFQCEAEYVLTELCDDCLFGRVRTVFSEGEVTILWVSGEIEDINKVVKWNGGFLVPVVGDNAKTLFYTNMNVQPAGSIDGDTYVILHNEGEVNIYNHIIREWEEENGK